MRTRTQLATLRKAGTLHLNKGVDENEGATVMGGQGAKQLIAQQRE